MIVFASYRRAVTLFVARTLGVHPNAIYARVQRINDLTGPDAQRYHALTELLLAADCRRN